MHIYPSICQANLASWLAIYYLRDVGKLHLDVGVDVHLDHTVVESLLDFVLNTDVCYTIYTHARTWHAWTHPYTHTPKHPQTNNPGATQQVA